MLDQDIVKFAHNDLHSKYEGMLNKAGAIIAALVINALKNSVNSHNVLEIGVYKGKFIALCAYILRDTQYNIYGIDPFVLENQSREQVFQTLNNNFNMDFIYLIKAYSNEYEEINKHIDQKKFLLIHIDGCHKAKNVFEDILYADKVIDDDGILILDDFFNKSSMGVFTGFGQIMLTTSVDFTPFLIGNTKLYLCRKKNFIKYKELILGLFYKNRRLKYFDDFIYSYENKVDFYTKTDLFNNEILWI